MSANAHGRGLAMRPLVDDVEALTVVGPDGAVRRCSRTENRELFSLVVGGYGLFGAIATVTLRLSPRIPVQRHVAELASDGLLAAFAERIAAGHLYGDFQFAIDPASDDFLHRRGTVWKAATRETRNVFNLPEFRDVKVHAGQNPETLDVAGMNRKNKVGA